MSLRISAARGATELPGFECIFNFNFDITHDYRQHLLVDIDPRYPIGHRSSLAGSGERAAVLNQGRGLSLHSQETTMPNYPLNTHAPDQTATTASTSPVSSRSRHSEPLEILPNFHGVSRATWPLRTASKLLSDYRNELRQDTDRFRPVFPAVTTPAWSGPDPRLSA
jgi:hypothetical protein